MLKSSFTGHIITMRNPSLENQFKEHAFRLLAKRGKVFMDTYKLVRMFRQNPNYRYWVAQFGCEDTPTSKVLKNTFSRLKQLTDEELANDVMRFLNNMNVKGN